MDKLRFYVWLCKKKMLLGESNDINFKGRKKKSGWVCHMNTCHDMNSSGLQPPETIHKPAV